MERRLFDDLVVSRGAGARAQAGGMPVSLALHAAALTGLLALSMVAPVELPVPRGPIVQLPPGPASPAGVAAPAPRPPSRPRAPRPKPDPTVPVLVPVEDPELEPWSPFDEDPGVGDPCEGCDPLAEPTGGGGGGAPGSGGGTTADPDPPRVRVGGRIEPPRKIRHVDPVYPELAQRTGVAGIVILECVIDRDGRIRSVQVLRGHPLLDAAATDAVRQWTYRPTLLNGTPVEVVMTVTVRFASR